MDTSEDWMEAMARNLSLIDVDYTAKDGIGTLTVATDDRDVASNLRDVFFQVQQAVRQGRDFRLIVETF